jgi:hypothetical protein
MPKWSPQTTHTDIAAFSDDPRVRKIVRRHRLIVISVVVVLLTVIGISAKPAYRAFRDYQIGRILQSAQEAARTEDWGTARNRARSVLLARPGDFDAYRIWHEALSHMNEPRTHLVAANLFVDPRSTRTDRLNALGVLARQGPEAVALGAYASLDESMREDPAALAALSPLLTRRGETTLVEKVLRESPAAATDPGMRLELLRALCAQPTAERVAEARDIFAKLIADGHSNAALEALLILGETPGGLAAGPPLPTLPDWLRNQPEASTLHHLLAIHPSIDSVPEAADALIERAIERFLAVDPGVLGTWLIRHNRTRRAADLLAEAATTDGPAFIARLHALLRENDSTTVAELLNHPPDSVDLVDLELAKAAAARIQNNPAAEANAWTQALNHAAFDQSRNRFLEIGKYAASLNAAAAADDAWVAGIRIGWGPIPLARDLEPVLLSLATKGRSEDLLAIYRSLLRFEPHNPDLINNFYYLALIHGVVSPADAVHALTALVAAHPDRPEFRSALAMAFLVNGQPDQTLEQIPYLESSPRVSPLMRNALQGSALIVSGNPELGSPLLATINWRTFLRQESLTFRNILTELELRDLPIPDLADIQPEIDTGTDPDAVPAWRRAVERLEKERANDTLPPLPIPRIPGTENTPDSSN